MSLRSDDHDDAVVIPARSAWGGHALAALALLGSLLLVFLYWRSAQQRELQAAHAEFVAETDAIVELLRQRMANYDVILRGGVSLFASVERPSKAQWQDYVSGLKLQQHFPTPVGLGFALSLSRGDLIALQQGMRNADGTLYTVYPAGAREHYGPVFYLQPETRGNLKAVGYDMLSEPVRQEAMLAARDSGDTRLSAGVTLIQDGVGPGLGLLMYTPVYRDSVPTTLAARRAALQGWVYMPFRVQVFVHNALSTARRRARLVITDLQAGPLYSEPPVSDDAQDLFVRTAYLDLYGRRWRLDFSALATTRLAAQAPELHITLAVGLIASLLLFGIVLALARTQSRARRLAARMSESYRRSELRFRNAMRYSAIGKALLDRRGSIVEANPAMATILGADPRMLPGTLFAAHFVDGRDDARTTREMQALREGVHRTTRELRRADGELRLLRLTYAPVPGEIGQDVASLVQVEDVTEQMRAEAREQALNRTLEARVTVRTRELQHANQELETFAYSVSHDLRTPLRTIEGFSRLLAERYHAVLDDEGLGYLQRVRNAVGRMDGLIDALLKMSRVSRSALGVAPLDLGRIAHDVVDELRAAHPGHDVEVVIASDLHAAGDPALVRNLLQNLIGNAWKFSRDAAAPCIEVGKGEDRDGRVEFFVRDNGAGFASEYRDKLFRPFQRLHHQDEFAGHGIGLASVKRIVERHGGTIRAEGQTGAGATFYFTLGEGQEAGD